jgi:hypothetical protein
MFGKNLSENAKKIVDFLGCPYEYFPSGKSADSVVRAYEDAFGKRNVGGYTPIVVVVDNILVEWLDELKKNEFAENETSAQYRERILEQNPINAVKWITDKLSAEKASVEKYGGNWENDVIGQVSGGGKNTTFSGHFDFVTNKSKEVILAKIPVTEPWRVFAWLPFGGWNECPTTDVMLAVGRHWFEKYGAAPAVISHDTLEFSAQPLHNKDMALGVAAEQFAFCSDVVYQGAETVGALADLLTKSTVWSFWWD